MTTRFLSAVRQSSVVFRLAVLIGAVLPIGCSAAMDPITYLHQDEGGEIAKDRPPIPQADAPYPNLATVPARPAAPDEKARANVAKGLAADRTNAQYTLATVPLPAPQTAAPAQPPAPVSTDEAAGATLQAAATPVRAVKVAGNSAAPASNVSSNPAPSATSASTSGLTGAQKVLQPMREARPAEPVASLPPLADAPPPPPKLAGMPASTAPTPPKPAPADFVPPAPAAAVAKPAPSDTAAPATASASAAPVPAASNGSLRIGFPPGSSTLPGSALAALKMFSHERGVHSMVVTGFGDVASSDAQAQAGGLSLALARARAVAAYLSAVGVPPAAMRVGAEAIGQGAAIRLAD